ncbi:MAG: hypothetical protein HC836_47260 [Richelia sp. RM2_1_2]|nr:hypothetical protein [Richelia sp. RM2_1_2]
MSDTVGSLVDKLITVDMKMWHNQESLYEIRNMNFEQFKAKYLSEKESQIKLFELLKKLFDLNVQRSNLIDEIDERILNIIADYNSKKPLDSFVQKKHKTY